MRADATTEEPRRRIARAALVVLAMTGAIAALATLGRTWIDPVPPRVAADFAATARTVARDGAPLWNGRVGIGEPLLAQPEAGALAPTRLLLLVTGPENAARLAGHLALWLAGLGLFALLGALGCSSTGALLGALAGALASPLVAERHHASALAIAGLPWILFWVERLAFRPSARGIAALSLTVGLTGLAGHLPALTVVAVVAMGWAAIRTPRAAVRAMLATLLGVALGAGLAAPWLLPALSELGADVTALKPRIPAAVAGLFGVALPPVLHSGWATGGIVLAIAMVGLPFGVIVGTARWGPVTRFALLAASALTAMVWLDERLALLAGIALAGAATVGFEAIVRGRGEGGPPPLAVAVVGAGVVILGCGIVALIQHLVERDPTVTFATLLWHPELRSVLPSLALRAAAVVVGVVALAAFLRGPLPRRVCAVALIGCVLADTVGGRRLESSGAPSTSDARPTSDEERFTAVDGPLRFGDVRFVDARTPPAVAALVAALPDGQDALVPPALARFDVARLVAPRRLGVPLAPRWVAPGEQAVDRISLEGAWGGGDGMLWSRPEAQPPLPLGTTIARVTVRAADDRVVTVPIASGARETPLPLDTLNGPLAALEIVYLAPRGRLWLTRLSPGRERPDSPWGQRGPHPLVAADGGGAPFVYGWPGRPGTAWLANSVAAIPDRATRVRAVATTAPGTATLSTPPEAEVEVPDPTPARKAVVRDRRDGRLTIDVREPGNWLVVSECFSPGWTATSGDATLPCQPVDHALVGVQLTAAARDKTVILRYYPVGLNAGLATAAAALIALALLSLSRRGSR